MEASENTARFQNTKNFKHTFQLVATRFLDMLEHTDAEDIVETLVPEWECFWAINIAGYKSKSFVICKKRGLCVK